MSGDKYLISDQHAPYFISCTAVHWIDLFSRIDYKGILVDSHNHCIMTSHGPYDNRQHEGIVREHEVIYFQEVAKGNTSPSTREQARGKFEIIR